MRKMIFTLTAALALCSAAGQAIAQDQAADPLLDVAADMNAAALKLGKLRTDTPTQDAQQSALKKLDSLIKELEEQKNRRGQGPGGNKPLDQSMIVQGPGGMGSLHADRKEGKKWGELPPKERERILQSMNDGFPSHYQKILERYFARLADEKPLADGEAGADAPAADAKTTTVEPKAGGETKAAPAAAGAEKEAK
jgi:hypothetical protein